MLTLMRCYAEPYMLVYAIFDCDVRIIDIAKMNALREQLLQELTNPPGGNELLEERLERLVLHDKYLDDTRNSIECKCNG